MLCSKIRFVPDLKILPDLARSMHGLSLKTWFRELGAMPDTTILVAEDETQTRDAISLVLENAGYKVLSVGTGREASARLQRLRGPKDHIGLLILDVEMDGLTGAQVLESLRSQGDLTPAVVVTGLAGAELLPRLWSLGPMEILAKPFDPSRLLNAVSRALGNGSEAGHHIGPLN